MDAPPTHGSLSEFARPERPGDLTPFLNLLIQGKTLTFDESRAAFGEIVTGSAHHAEMGAFLALLARRLPTVDELAGAATVMREHATTFSTSIDTAKFSILRGLVERQRHSMSARLQQLLRHQPVHSLRSMEIDRALVEDRPKSWMHLA